MPFATVYAVIVVSIHATLAGGDSSKASPFLMRILFLSTPPSRVATAYMMEQLEDMMVSIHATLAGGDLRRVAVGANRVGFLSTPPSRVATILLMAELIGGNCFYPRHPRGWRL